MYALPGQKYSHLFDWDLVGVAEGYPVWKSNDAGLAWIRDGDSVFVDFVFNAIDDKGDLGKRFLDYNIVGQMLDLLNL